MHPFKSKLPSEQLAILCCYSYRETDFVFLSSTRKKKIEKFYEALCSQWGFNLFLTLKLNGFASEAISENAVLFGKQESDFVNMYNTSQLVSISVLITASNL